MPKPRVTDIDRQLGARLQKLRQQEGISAAVLAEAIGSTQQQISRYENGQNKLGAAQLYRLSQYLGTPVSWFFQGCEDDSLAALAEQGARRNEIKEKTTYYERSKVNEELQSLQTLWPRLSKVQRTAVLRLLDSFLV